MESRRVGAALSGDDHLEVVRFDLTDPAAWSATFAGAERMFLLRPPQLFRVGRDLLLALEAAAAGVGHVVFLSIQGRPHPAGAHRAVEDPTRLADGLDYPPGQLLPAEPVHHPRPRGP